MEKIVKSGLRDCTVILDGTECAVKFDTCFRAFSVRNDGAADVYISKSSGIVPDADGVMCVKSGSSAVFAHNDLDKNAVYLLGTGKVMVHGQQDSNNPFNFAPTIDGGVQASGNPVIMDNLQGGVPFSEMVVSGKNLIGIAQAKGLTGDNTNGFFVFDNSASRSIIQKLQPNTTYFIKKYDSGNRFRIVMFDDEPTNTADVNAQQLIYNTDGSISDYTLSTGENHLWMVLATHYATSGDAIEPIVQLELGSTPTAYEPPITGRELTVNASGKNLLQKMTDKTIGGLHYSPNDDGSVSVTGTQTAENYPTITSVSGMLLKPGKYALSGGTERLQITALDIDANTVIARAKIAPATFSIDTDKYIRIYIFSAGTYNSQTFDDVIYPQLEIGSTATDYEPYHGSTTTITPSSNPYVIPNDIRQVDGFNVVSVSEGEISVTGVRKNAALKKIWDEIDEIKTAIIVSNGESE